MTVAEFIAKIGLDSTKFTEGTNKVKRDVASLKGEIGKFAPALAGAFTVAGLVGLGKKAIETGAHFYDMAQKLGVSTDSIQRMDYAAKQTGVDIDKVTRAILKMQGELSHGGWDKDKYASALSTLRLKPEDLVGKSPEDVLLRLADAFSGVTNRAEANAAIVSLVGIKMAGIIPMISRGSAALKEFFDAAPVASLSTIVGLKQIKQDLDSLARISFPALGGVVTTVFNSIKGAIFTTVAGFSHLYRAIDFAGRMSVKGTSVADAWRLSGEDQGQRLEKLHALFFTPPPDPKDSSFIANAAEKQAEKERHESRMQNLDKEYAHLKQKLSEAGLEAEKELEAKRRGLFHLQVEAAWLRSKPAGNEREELLAENRNEQVRVQAAIAEVQQRIDRERAEAAEALAKKTQDVEDARFQNSLILMSTEEKRIALLQREQELVQQITKLREGGQAQAATEREKDLESLRAEQLRLDKKDQQQTDGGQPFSVFTNELQRRGGAGAAVVGYGGSEVLHVAKEQLETQKRTEKLIFELNQRAQQNLSTSGVFS
jgi:hypothetical protein